MTPTEQDKELRAEVKQILKDGFNYYIGERKDVSSDMKPLDTYCTEHLMQLFTADRERVALEARIDEINYLDDNFQVDSQDWEREHPGYSTAMIPMEDYIRRRTELKAQQEEV